MGQGESKLDEKDPKGLVSIINYVATNYILTQSFQEMKKLADTQYCDKLVVMTADVLNNYLDKRQITYLQQKIRDGVDVNEMAKEDVAFIGKDDLSKLDMRSPLEKKRMCIGIAKYYVKIAHLFGAIVTTINPEYVYKDQYGETKRVPLAEKDTIPADASTRISRFNICSSRINALIGGQSVDPDGDLVTVKPKFCNMNVKNGVTRGLTSEPGIPELKKLYYDEYNYETGKYSSMSDKMKKTYQNDVARFYKTFTGETRVPDTVKSFSDIKLKDLHLSKGCATGGMYTKGYEGSVKDKLFAQYIEHIKKMMQTAETNQNKLLTIIDELFSFTVNPQTLKKEITINPNLTDISLQESVEKTRNIIIDLYLTCEDDFLAGLQIFEAIVAKQIMETSTEQVESLKALSEKHLSEAAKIADDIGKAPNAIDAAKPEPAPLEPAKPKEESPLIEELDKAKDFVDERLINPKPDAETMPKTELIAPIEAKNDEGITEMQKPNEEVIKVDPEQPKLVIDVNESGQRQLKVMGGSRKVKKTKKRLTRRNKSN
jgi:hypothetical protein